MRPPYQITSLILELVASVSEKIGVIKIAQLGDVPAKLRKENRIKTIQASLEIEGNTLTVEQITAVLDNKRVLAPAKEILEVKNAIVAYKEIANYKPYQFSSLCSAHKLMMDGLIDQAGKIRTKDVGILKGKAITHLAPPAHLAGNHLKELLQYVKSDPDLMLIKSCVFHYEFEFIHPFTDGNGRLGRLWQSVLLRQYHNVFDYLPVETLIKEKQTAYYEVLATCDKVGNSTLFIEFMLSIINEALDDLISERPVTIKADDRVRIFCERTAQKTFKRKSYMDFYKSISSATASRDLIKAVEDGILQKSGSGNLTIYKIL